MNNLSQRLMLARKSAGLSQETAASHLGMSRPTFIAMEKGTRNAKPDELTTLAALYGTTLNRLLRESAPPPEIAPHLRAVIDKEGDEAGLESAVAKLTEFVDDYLFLQSKVPAHANPVPPAQPTRSLGSVERFAEHCAIEQRRLLGFGDSEPIGSLRDTLDEIGIHIFIDGLNSKLAGLYAFVENFGYCVLINRKHPLARQRWTIAHEYGHYLFDHDRRGVDYVQPMKRKPENERFCDTFASHFLMPTTGVQKRFHDTFQRKGDVNVGDVIRISDYYGVSLMAMMLRLETIGLIRKGSWDAIKASGRSVKEIRQAALDENALDDQPVFAPNNDIFPERYLLLAISAWSNEEITTSQFAKLVRRSVPEARDLAQSRSQLLGDNDDSLIELNLGSSVVFRESHSA
ncbi:XRE family transcriptional regulator [Xanthomonas nasturtii]|uniref:helix-turn-helix domain-containing protein n=1 Tax=Xanthomonas TaxID=338 RepID=UPI0012A92F8D|nr:MULTISPECIES: XRE family transcriptional regulator [Xanthomonas]MCE4280740.1 XRE family transcriptional regulator [Xanthomonas hortorum pv. vitians]MCE4286826.1 XRE family transcriptional regulator [Xanthomonas hortorum pv. vitians]MCE4288001.1 XRE family transcriptional regulator [Xanthomonas hortorum pv. vitians]MCE4295629.1 XRE family transcriptional regulator [Xanthomonas hortorum pv. vitians]MCE4513464.1 XRE family transcriptional regulator [Xanthomonas hortorum pv. vitians]